MRTYALNKDEYFDYSPEFLNIATIKKLLKLDISKVKDTELVSKQLKKMTKTDLLAVVKGKAPVFKYEAIDLDGVSFKKNEDIESIVKKVFKYAEADKDIGRKAIKAKFSEVPSQPLASPKRDREVKLAASTIDSQVNNYMDSASSVVLKMMYDTCSDKPVEEYVDHANQGSSKVTRSVSEGKIWYKINDKPVLTYDARLQTMSAGDVLDVVMKWVTVVLDILSIIATLIGIIATKISDEVLSGMCKLLVAAWDQLRPAFEEFGIGMKQAADASQGKERIIAMFKALCEAIMKMMKLGSLVWNIVKIFLSHLRWWQVLICVISFIATLVVIIASQGSAVILKVIALAAQFVILAADVVTAVIATV